MSSDSGLESINNKKLTTSVTRLRERVDSVKTTIDKCLQEGVYQNASTEDKVKYDLFLAYATTSLFWAYLRTTGVDPHTHPIKDEVERIKTYMAKAKTVHDRHLRPKVNKDASKRFVRNALWVPDNKDKCDYIVPYAGKRTRFDEDEETEATVENNS